MLESTAAVVSFVLLIVFTLTIEGITYKKYTFIGLTVNVIATLITAALLFLQFWWPYMLFVLIAQPALYWLPLKKEARNRKISLGNFLLSLTTTLAIFYGVYGALYLLNRF